MDLKEYYIENVEQYILVINENFPRFSLSRGQWRDQSLFPSALRLDETGMRIFSDNQIELFLDDFKNESLQYIHGYGSDIQNDYEWLVYAQHFGVPTRLLDFTFSHLVSLMFAVEKAFDEDDDDETSVVWLLDCGYLNGKAVGNNDIVNLSSYNLSVHDVKYPCAVTARKINPRVIAQNGVFVLFQKESPPLEKIDIAKDVLRKIIIPHTGARRIISELYAMGMRFNSLYPELTSVSKDILLKNNVMEYLKMENENE